MDKMIMGRKIFLTLLIAAIGLLVLICPLTVIAASDTFLELHFDEGSGNIASDSSGNGNDAMIHGATWVDGVTGKALLYDGVNDYTELIHPSPFSQGTIEGWVKFSKVPTTYPPAGWMWLTISRNPIDKMSDGVDFGVHPGNSKNLAFGIWGSQGWYWADSGVQPQANKWYYLVATWGPAGMKTYVNGELKGTNASYKGGLWDQTKYCYLGANTWKGYVNGVIDNVVISKKVLSQSEIQARYITTLTPPSGSIDVTSVPPGAKVYVDSVYKGETPFKIDKVSAGTHSVQVLMDGYANQTKSVIVKANTASPAPFTLKAIEGAACDDKDKCTIEDIITNGECTGTPKVCDDKNPATEDSCNSNTGACVSAPKKEGAVCEDGDVCTVDDVMIGGKCTPGSPRNCNDQNTTTDDSCNPKSGCVHTLLKKMFITFTFSPQTVNTGEPANLVITVGGDGTPVADAKVAWSAAPLVATLDPQSTTNSTGMAVSTFSAPQEGTYTITATVTKEGYLTEIKTLTIPVKSGWNLMTLLPLILVVLIIAIIAIIVLFLLTRNRLQLIVKQPSVPADGRSTIPVKVQFTSGLGSLKNQSVDRDVSLTATSGTIKPVIVNRGKAFTETMLTASRDVGKVKVTAQYEKMQAEAIVNFTLEGGLIEISAEPMELPADGKSAATVTLRLKDKANLPVSFMDEKTAQISTTLGTIPHSIKIPPHATQVTTSLVSGTVIGIATITVLADQLKGEAKVKIGALAERYCQRCGMKVTMEAVICLNCKHSPTIPDTDTKQCPFCKEELPRSATYCNRCGRNQAQQPSATPPRQDTRQPATAPQRQETPRAAEVTPKKKFCGNCGKENVPGKKFCSNCGAKIN